MYEVDIKELRKVMIDAGIITAAALADKAKISRATAENVLNGEAYPSSVTMSKIARACNLSGEEAGRIFFKEKLAYDVSKKFLKERSKDE